ncbi:MAG: efflux RND transporter periplasmic adaptor subunit [Vulcanimicrobiota bacterium]
MLKLLNRFKWLLIIIIVAAIAFVVWGRTQQDKKKINFDTEKLDRGTITSTVNTTGTVNAVTSVEIGCQVSGKIIKLYVDYNSPVKKGMLLAQIDPLVYQSQVDEANANLLSARATNANSQAQYQNALSKVREFQSSEKNSAAQVEVAKANLAGARNNEKSALANLKKAEAQLQNDLVEFNRSQELMKKDFISRSEMDAAETKYKVSLASVDVARAGFNQASSTVLSTQMQRDGAIANLESSKIAQESQKASAKAIEAQVRQSAAQILNAESKLKGAMINLGYTNIYSPINGVVVSRSVDVGQTVAASFTAPKLFTLAKDLRDMEVYANVDEADIGNVKESMKATFTVDAYQKDKFNGTVKQVRKASTLDQGVVKYQVVISAGNPDLKLMPGMTANVIITSEAKDDCLMIPNGAIRFRPDSVANFPFPPDYQNSRNGKNGKNNKGKKDSRQGSEDEIERFSTVWIYMGEHMVRPEKIITGITDGKYTEMKKGNLREGDSVITGVQAAKAKATTSAPRSGGAPGGGPPPGGGGPGGPRMRI